MHYIYSALQKTIEHKYKHLKNIGYVLMFHEVTDCKGEWDNENYAMCFTSFRALIESMQSNQIQFRSLDYLLSEQSANAVYVTFDDIYASAFNFAIPFLEEKDIPYCCFIATDLIGRQQYLSHQNLEFLAQSELCTIGSHTCSHNKLRSLPTEDRFLEFANSKKILEKECNLTIDYLAYPYGSKSACPSNCLEIAKKTGYRTAFSAYSMPLNKRYIEKHPFFVPRINVNEKNYCGILKKIEGDFLSCQQSV